MRAAKPITAWVVEAAGKRSRWYIPHTLRQRRTDTLSIWLGLWEQSPSNTWAHWRRKGYRLVRLTMTGAPDA